MKYSFIKIIFLAFWFLTIQVSGQIFDVEKDESKMRKNHIKTQTKWKYRPGSDQGTKIVKRIYDRQGNIVEEINYKPSGEIATRLNYKYDKNGNKIEYTNYNEEEDKLKYKQNIFYDEQGRKIKEEGFDGISNFKIEYNYIGNTGKLKEIIKYDEVGQVEEKWEYNYERNTETIKIYKGGKNLANTIINKYDPVGNLLEKTKLNESGEPLKRNVYVYGSKGRLLTEQEYYAGKLSFTLYYFYDKRGNLSKVEKETPDGKRFVNNDYSYDETDNLVRELWYDGIPDDYSKKSYDYDKSNNLTEVNSYYSLYKYKALYKYTYEKY